MSLFTMGAGSGGGLNFQVVGGTAQPSNPKENTVWVNTDTDITQWAFSADEPNDPVEGMVWFETGTASATPISALKKNTLMVYPNVCYQYISGMWQPKTAVVYINGTWVSWRTYVFTQNSLSSASQQWKKYTGNPTLELSNGALSFNLPLSGSNASIAGTIDRVVIPSGATKLIIDYSRASGGGGNQNRFGLASSQITGLNGGGEVAYVDVGTATSRVQKPIDVTAYRGNSYYLYFSGTVSGAVVIYNIWFE